MGRAAIVSDPITCALCWPERRHRMVCERCLPGCLDNLPPSPGYAAWVRAGRPQRDRKAPAQTEMPL